MNINKHISAELTPEQQSELDTLKGLFNNKLNELMEQSGKHHADLDLSLVWNETNDLGEIYDQLHDLKLCLDSFRPFDAPQMKNLHEVFDTEYTYASNRIEGNTLTLRETSFVINEGLTIENKSMKEHLEAINHKEAIIFIRELVEKGEPINERNIKLIHSLILHSIDRENAGAYRGVSVGISGTEIVFPQPYIVPKLMEELIQYYEDSKDTFHPVKLAAHMHSKLVNIHPFIDGNGRTCRLLMNFILLQNGYPVTIFSPETEHRDAYFNALNVSRDKDDLVDFELFAAKLVKKWIFTYLNLIAPNGCDESKGKGYEFFKRVEPII